MKKSDIGRIGEENACKFLIKKGYKILKRNYWQKFGEIDIIAKAPNRTLVFIEVKALLIKREFSRQNGFSPEDNFTTHKYNKVKRICEFFVGQNEELIDEEKGWQVDLVAIEFFGEEKGGKFEIRHYENI